MADGETITNGYNREGLAQFAQVSADDLSAETSSAGQRSYPVLTIAVVSVGLIALSVLGGWLFDVRALKSVLPVLTTMKANTAVCLGLLALATWLSRTHSQRQKYAVLVVALSQFVLLIASITACEYLFNWDAGIDELLFRDIEHQYPYPAGRPAPATAVSFLCISLALLMLERKPRLSHGLTLFPALISLVALIGYLYKLPTLYGAGRYTSLALHTTFGILLVCVAVCACRPELGLTGLLTGSWRRRSNIHTFIATAVLLPIALGSVVLQGERMGWYGAEFTLALDSVLLIVFTIALVWITSLERQHIEWQRLETEQLLTESEERFRGLADNIPNLVWMANPDGHIFWYNRRWYEYTGTTLLTMSGWGWGAVHDPEMLPSVVERWQEALATGKALEMVFPLRGADGTFRPFLTRVQPVRGKNGRIVRWFGTNTDIGAERTAQEELRKANRELEEYAYVSSHDLQEPLRMVHIYTELLMRELEDKFDDRTKEYGFYVLDGVKRMQRLIKDLLQFSRTIADSSGGAIVPVANLNSCCQNAISTLGSLIQESDALVTVGQLPKVVGEESQLTQVFQNLISNALKYRKTDVRLHVEISSQHGSDGEWVTCVRDNGIGFDPKFASRVFGLFQRLHANEYPGTGLGLAICRRIIERYGGRIWAEAQDGMGAIFYFTLPPAES